jgi:hypothetical protein
MIVKLILAPDKGFVKDLPDWTVFYAESDKKSGKECCVGNQWVKVGDKMVSRLAIRDLQHRTLQEALNSIIRTTQFIIKEEMVNKIIGTISIVNDDPSEDDDYEDVDDE